MTIAGAGLLALAGLVAAALLLRRSGLGFTRAPSWLAMAVLAVVAAAALLTARPYDAFADRILRGAGVYDQIVRLDGILPVDRIAGAIAWVQQAQDLVGRALPDPLGGLLGSILPGSTEDERGAGTVGPGRSGDETSGPAATAGPPTGGSGYFEHSAYPTIVAVTTLALRAGGYALAVIGMVLVAVVSMAATAVDRQRRCDELARSLEERIARLEAWNRDVGVAAPR